MVGTEIASSPDQASVCLTIPEHLIQALPAEVREDPEKREAYLLKAVELGLKCLAVAGIQLDVDHVRTEFGRIERAVNGIEKGLGELVATELTDDDSSLVKTLNAGVSDLVLKLRKLSSELADPKHADSVPAKTKALLDEFFNKPDGSFRNALNLSHEGSPLKLFLDETGRKIHLYRKELDDRLRPFEERFGKLESNIERLLDQAGFKAGMKEAVDKSSAKGSPFEEQVADVLTRASSHNKDLVELVGEVLVAGTRRKRGDVLVHVHEEQGEVDRIVIEAKAGDYTVRGKEGLLVELAEAMDYRQAAAGIAVGTRAHAKKNQRPLEWQGSDRIVVVVDREDEEHGFLSLEVAHAVLRDRVLARSRRDVGAIDQDGAEKTILAIANAVDKAQSLKTGCTTALNTIKHIRANVGEMEDEIRAQLAVLKTQLGVN